MVHFLTKENWGGSDGYVNNFDWGDGFMSVCYIPKYQIYTFNMWG